MIFLQEIYLEYLFTPGRFSNAAIQKALQVSEREFGMLSVHPFPGPLDVRQQDSLELLPRNVFMGSPWGDLVAAGLRCSRCVPAAGSGTWNTDNWVFSPWIAQQVAELVFHSADLARRMGTQCPIVVLLVRICHAIMELLRSEKSLRWWNLKVLSSTAKTTTNPCPQVPHHMDFKFLEMW